MYRCGLLTVIVGVCLGGLASDVYAQGGAFKGYVRSNFQVGEDLRQGENLHTGFMPGQRLQEGQYFELGFVATPMDMASFHFLIAHGGNTFHFTDVWGADSAFSVRELYLELKNAPKNEDYRIWAGSRMYRGDDIHVYDTWILDNHNLLGVGVDFLTQFPFQLETAIGVKNGVGGTLSSATPGFSFTLDRNSQRYIFIVKPKFSLTDTLALKFNIEGQGTPLANGAYAESGTSFTQHIPSTLGVMGGAELSYWGEKFWRNLFVNFGYGDVIGGVTPPSVVDSTLTSSPAGGTAGVSTRVRSSALRVGSIGTRDFSRWSLMTGMLLDWVFPRGTPSYLGLNITVRPLFYLSDQWHVGFETSLISYPRQRDAADISHVVLTGILRYAMTRTIFGVPQIYLRVGNAYYFDPVTKYGSTDHYAFNINTGFELWY